MFNLENAASDVVQDEVNFMETGDKISTGVEERKPELILDELIGVEYHENLEMQFVELQHPPYQNDMNLETEERKRERRVSMAINSNNLK